MYRALPAPGEDARDLFGFVGAWLPPALTVSAGWGAWEGDRLAGALLLERAETAAMLYGPVVVASDTPDPDAAVEIAARLLDDALSLAEAQGIITLYTRPQSLDRVWVRNGFIPIPEADLPETLRGRPGIAQTAPVDSRIDALHPIDEVQRVAFDIGRAEQLGDVAQSLAVGQPHARGVARRRPPPAVVGQHGLRGG